MHNVLKARASALYVGIDPGSRGGIVAIDFNRNVKKSTVMPMVGKEVDLVALVEWLEDIDQDGQIFVALEKPSVRPGQNPSGTLTMGMNWGRLHAALRIAWTCNVQVITPQTWRRALDLPKSSNRAECKASALAAVADLLPELDLTPGRKTVPHDGLADAGLLAEYARIHSFAGRSSIT